jgi:hypothetical protein
MLCKAAILCVLLAALTTSAAEKVFDFFGSKIDETPAGFRNVLGGTGKSGDWRVIMADVPSLLGQSLLGSRTNNPNTVARRPVLAQLSTDPTDERFPMLVYEEEAIADFTLTTRFKLVDGVKEQMAGIAFRFQDPGNYYYIRASGLGNTFYFLKVVNGIRSAPIGNKVEIARGVWHDLTIECQGTQIRALLNGKEVLPRLDDRSHSSGLIGFWTKSDSVSYFTDTRLDYKPREILAESLVRDAVRRNPRLVGLKIYAATNDVAAMRTVATTEPEELGQPAPPEAEVVLGQRGFFFGKGNGIVAVTLPLHDSNGDRIAAVRVLMKSFPGQTEKNAVVRATPIVKSMEARIRSRKDLLQ